MCQPPLSVSACLPFCPRCCCSLFPSVHLCLCYTILPFSIYVTPCFCFFFSLSVSLFFYFFSPVVVFLALQSQQFSLPSIYAHSPKHTLWSESCAHTHTHRQAHSSILLPMHPCDQTSVDCTHPVITRRPTVRLWQEAAGALLFLAHD